LVHLRARSSRSDPIGFAWCYLAALAVHLVIGDRAYHPRCDVLIARTAAYLSLRPSNDL